VGWGIAEQMVIGAISMILQSCGIIPFSHGEEWADRDSNQINVHLHPMLTNMSRSSNPITCLDRN